MALLRLGLCPELNADVVDKLRQAGVKTVVKFLNSDSDFLSHKTSVSYKTIATIRQNLVTKYAAKCTDGSTLCEQQLNGLAVFSTGCHFLDALFSGGIYSGEVTEIWGPSAVGKTQFLFFIAASFVRNTQRTVLYIDTRNGFNASRILEILLHHGVSKESAYSMLDRIKYLMVHDIHELIDILEDRKRWSVTFGTTIALVIVDTIHALLAPILGGKHGDGMGLMGHMAQLLKALALDKMLAVIVCNGAVQGDLSSGMKPALGRYWQHVPSVSVRIGVSDLAVYMCGCQLKGDTRVLTLTKSCRQPTGQQITCQICKEGFILQK